jgi:hypothetical protein
VISVGDIVLLLGVGALIASTMRAGTVRRGTVSARGDFALAENLRSPLAAVPSSSGLGRNIRSSGECDFTPAPADHVGYRDPPRGRRRRLPDPGR